MQPLIVGKFNIIKIVFIALFFSMFNTQVSASIATGSEQKAKDYYARIANDIGFNFTEKKLGQFAAYLGYATLEGRQIELMAARSDYPNGIHLPVSGSIPAGTPASENLKEIPDDVQNLLLSFQDTKGVRTATFFAPKIVDYAGAQGHTPYADGWRKLVYLPAQPNSIANAKGMKGAYILFNYAQKKDANDDPLLDQNGRRAISKNNQIILVPKLSNFDVKNENEPLRGQRDTAYFAVFGEYIRPNTPNKSTADSYKTLLFLGAAFDTNDRGVIKKYYLPDACAHCHGHDNQDKEVAAGAPVNGKYPYVKPNYIDTDNLYDAMEVDFPELKNSVFSEPLLINKRTLRGDARNQFDLPEYQARFKVLYELNQQMYDESLKGMRDTISTAREKYLNGGSNDLFQTDGAAQWLSIHDLGRPKAMHPKSAVTRGYGYAKAKVFGDDQHISWNTSSKKHEHLATKMSQFCFRCHSTIKFSVMDLGTLYKKRGDIIGYVNSGLMPYGRKLSAIDKDCITETLRELDSGHRLKHDCNKTKAEQAQLVTPQPPIPSVTTPSVDLPKNGKITFRNEGGYVAKFTLAYMVDETHAGVVAPIPKIFKTRNLPALKEQSFNIPSNAKNITIEANMVTIGSPKIFSHRMKHPNGKTICKKVWGTIFSQGNGSCN